MLMMEAKQNKAATMNEKVRNVQETMGEQLSTRRELSAAQVDSDFDFKANPSAQVPGPSPHHSPCTSCPR